MFCDAISSHGRITSYYELVNQDWHEYRISSGGDVSSVCFRDIFEGLFAEGSGAPELSISFNQDCCAEGIVSKYIYNIENFGWPTQTDRGTTTAAVLPKARILFGMRITRKEAADYSSDNTIEWARPPQSTGLLGSD